MTMRKGWFSIPGIQTGDRSLDEQIDAVRPVLEECAGKTVLDLGCAEGLIAHAFAVAGAKAVLGVDTVPDHLAVARAQGEGVPNLRFEPLDLNLVSPTADQARWDIVLALGVLHKIQDPAPAVRWAARSAGELLAFRPKGGVTNGEVRSKHFAWNHCNAHEIFKAEGFRLERVVHGAHSEQVEMWRRCEGAIGRFGD